MDLKWDDAGLVTVVAQDVFTGEVRMVAHANRAAVDATLATGRATFYSRSRQSLWVKGESSGNTMAVHSVHADCDGDALIYLVDPSGPSCHTGVRTCFFHALSNESGETSHAESVALPVLADLDRTLRERKAEGSTTSYTARLLDEGPAKIAAKIREEGDELALALESESVDRVVSEAADVLYHAMVGLLARGASFRDVQRELARRFGTSGLDEKASRDA